MDSNPILMPKLGLTMTEGMLAEWRVQPGDHVKTGDLLFVVETDKIATDVEARAEGRIEKLLVEAGDTVTVGAIVARWSGPAQGVPGGEGIDQGGEESVLAPLDAGPASAETAASSDAPGHARMIATPLARRIARAEKISLEKITGSGPRGRIKARDVEAVIASAMPAAIHRPDPPAPVQSIAGDRRQASSFERTVARRLGESKQLIPHFYVMADADVTALLDLRANLNERLSTRISVNHLLLLAVGQNLRDQVEINCIWEEGDIVSLPGSDVGFAIDTEHGLFAPVLRDVGAMRLSDLAVTADELAARAREGRLRADELAGGAVTVSNVGMFGASWLIPIINPGQSAIIGVGRTRKEFRPDQNGDPMLRSIISLVMSADHRVHDGVKAARFLSAVVGLLENPLQLLV